MVVNSEGVEVNQDGSEITPEDKETSDWTQVLELSQKDNVKPLDIEVLAPSSVPHNIPYFEVYRTDELYAKDYISPFMTLPSDSTSGDDENDGGESNSDNGDNGNNGGSSSSNNGSSSSSNNYDTPHSSKTKNQKLHDEILNVVKNNYKDGDFSKITNLYITAKTSKTHIAGVTVLCKRHLKDGNTGTSLTNSIYKIKRKYS